VKWEILVIGRGGQGVLLFGRVIGLAATKYANYHAVLTESYAAETRGGESRVDLIISTSPEDVKRIRVENANVVVFMYSFNINKYQSLIDRDALVVIDSEYVNSDLFRGYKLVACRFSEIAEKNIGSRRVANMVILGKLIRETRILELEQVKLAVKELTPRSWLEQNIRALELGYSIID